MTLTTALNTALNMPLKAPSSDEDWGCSYVYDYYSGTKQDWLDAEHPDCGPRGLPWLVCARV